MVVQAPSTTLLSCGKTMLPMGILKKFNETALQQLQPGRNCDIFTLPLSNVHSLEAWVILEADLSCVFARCL